MQENYFENKKILVTGITGFIGSHLAEKLSLLGATVYGISRSFQKENIFKADISDFSIIHQIIKNKNINICFHLSADSLVESGEINPYYTFKKNMLGTLNILESTRKNKLDKVIIASTSQVYGDKKTTIYGSKPTKAFSPLRNIKNLR